MKNVLIIALTAAMLLVGCKKKEETVEVSVPNEGITTVIYTLVQQGTTDTVRAKWNQRLGTDGNPTGVPDTSQAMLALKANTSYLGHITIYDSTQAPPTFVNKEILELGSYHLFFYQPVPTTRPLVIPNTPNQAAPPLNLTVFEIDHDSSTAHYPIGLETSLTTGAASSGRLRIVLRHQPNVKNGTYAPGDSDIDLYLSVEIR